MSEEQDNSQKTEDPTRKRLEDAAERGQTVTSREANSLFILLAFTLMFGSVVPSLFRKTQFFLSGFIENPDTIVLDNHSIGLIMKDILASCADILFLPLISFVGAIILANLLQNRVVFSLEPIMPKFEKISPMKGLERLFSRRSLVEFLKSIVKITIVGLVAYYAILPYFTHIKQLPDVTIPNLLSFMTTTAKRMLLGVCIAMFFITIVDYLYQRFEFIKSLRMSKQEIKDEYRQQEGDPVIKQKIRQIRMERAKKRMMSAVPTADVIITNPTHYSIALKYEQSSMRAPRLVAKGVDNIALKIREVAKEHNIPLVENPPLARALYATVEIDKEIPAEHYKAVAEVISYVYRIRGKLKF